MPILRSRPSDLISATSWGSALACLVLLVGAGCGARPLRTSEARTESDAGAVPVDPVTSLPRPADLAKAGDTVAALRTPLPEAAVLGVVRHLFEAFHARSTAPIEPDLDELIVDIREASSLPSPGDRMKFYFLTDLATRLKGAPFDQLDLEQMYHSQEVELYAREDLGMPGRPQRPNAMGPDDVLVRIPIATPRLGADVLFGEEIRLLLRREGTTYRIHGYFESVPR